VPRGLTGGTPAGLGAEAAGYLVEPGRQLGLSPELPHASEGGKQRFLEHVPGVLLVAAHPEPEAEHLLLVTREERLQRFVVTSPRRVQKLLVAPCHLLSL